MAMLQITQCDIPELKEIQFDQDKIVIGRSKHMSDYVISEKDTVSRQHAQFILIGDHYYIEDPREEEPQKKKHRTFVNDSAIPYRTPVQLKHQDRIRICEFNAVFIDDDPSTVEAMLSSNNESRLDTQPAAKLAAILEITHKLSQTLHLEAKLPEVAERLLQLFPQADRCFIIFADEENGDLKPKVVRARVPIDDSETRFSHTIVRKCLSTKQATLRREGEGTNTPTSQSMIAFQMRSVMCVPLAPEEGPALGVIQLDTQDASKKFTEDDLRLLWGVAYQATVAIENSRYHDMRIVQERIRKELEMARQVAFSFMPQAMPVVPGYDFFSYCEPAREVGGDYFDFIPLADNRFGISLGDVAGKGMPAALFMVRANTESRSFMLTENNVERAMERLNARLCPYTAKTDGFVTQVSIILDPATHTATVASAGHPAPLIFRHATGKIEECFPIDMAGPLLGIDEKSAYRSCSVTLEAGDCVLLFSDGLTDAKSSDNVTFRLSGIHAAVAEPGDRTPSALGERVVQAVLKHAKGRSQYDDLTLVCFGRLAK